MIMTLSSQRARDTSAVRDEIIMIIFCFGRRGISGARARSCPGLRPRALQGATVTVIMSKLGNVIDIMAAEAGAGARIDTWPRRANRDDNQRWTFIPDPAGSGYFFITSALDGYVIDIEDASTGAGAWLDAVPRNPTDYSSQLWGFVPDPAGSGYFFITNATDGTVIDVAGTSMTFGARLDAWPRKSSDYDNQLWKPLDGSFPAPAHSALSWGPAGTEAPPDSTTVGSGTTKCAYQASLSIHANGACTFSGYYQNRGDAALLAAPAQQFSVIFAVYDSRGRAYSFSYSGSIPSAPQPGSLVSWSRTQMCPTIVDNWYAIAARNSGEVFANNWTDVSFWDAVGSLPATIAHDADVAVANVETALSIVEPPLGAVPATGPTTAAVPGTRGAGTHGRSASGRLVGRDEHAPVRALFRVG
jgi:hypothetical protein